ncbi:MAG: HlyD family efflux transporter periplasmic adaptor subunit [Pseudomonadota bacterium]
MLNPDRNPNYAEEDSPEPSPNETGSTKRSGWRVAWLGAKTLISLGLAFAIIFVGNTAMERLIASRPDVPQRPQFERQVPVTTQTLAVQTHSPTISVFGEVVTARLVDLRALVAGEITSVHPNLVAGGRINAGEPIVEIDRFTYEGAVVEAEANLTEAQARLTEAEARLVLEQEQLIRAEEQVFIAQRDLARAQQLAESGSLTDRDLDNRRLTVSQRLQTVEQRQATIRIEEARIEQQRAGLARLEWRLAEAERDLERTVLNAPFSGVVRTESVEPGRLISVNDVVATMFDDSSLNVRFTLSDSQFGRLASEADPLIGRPITVTWSTGGENVMFEGKIDRLDADISAASGGVALFGSLQNGAATGNLRPGAFISVQLADRAFEDTIRVPETALYNSQELFIAVDGRLQSVLVDLVAWDGAFALVRPKADTDLDGAELVTSRLTDAGDGVAVRPIGAERQQRPSGPSGGERPETAQRQAAQ